MAYDDDEALKRNRGRSWWQQRTQMERRIILLLILALAVIIGLIIGIAVVSHKKGKNGNQTEDVCLTQGCVNTAAEVLKNMDQSIDPCDDFYQFACGSFIKAAEIPPDKSEVNVFSVLRDLVKKQLRGMFEQPVKANEPKPFVLVKKFYDVCMNTTAIELDGLTTIKRIFKNMGGWPVLEGRNWNEAEFDWLKAMLKFRKQGMALNAFINIGAMPNPLNSTQRILALDQAVLDIRRESLVKGLSDPLVNAYYEYMVDLAVYFGVDRNFAEFEVKNMINLKVEIGKICLADEQRRNVVALTNVMTVAELQQKYPRVRWLDFINGMIDRPDKNLTATDVVNVFVPQYINSLIDLLTRIPRRDQANYAFFQSAAALVDYLPDRIRDRKQQYEAVTSGAAVRQPRWIECVDSTTETLKLGVGALYVRNYFHEEARQGVIEMVSDIRKAFVKIVEQLDWMDETTRKVAVDKALSMVTHIGFADEYLDDKKLEDYYSKLTIRSGSYVQTMFDIVEFITSQGLSELKDPVNKTDWKTRLTPSDINAGYSPQENSIQFPAGILQGVFFNKDRPRYMNYGAIAYVIGHEITHGFDDQGKHYDKEGNLVNWWAEKTDKAYADKAKCIVDQYSEQIVPELGLHLNGENTQGENIADNGGIKEAYMAYNAWIERNGPESTLPGLNYTAKQMFWISAANCWCSKERKESLESDLSRDVHSPNRYRVLLPFANTKYFAYDFNCPVGSKMNPKHKCQVW